jgi:anthranilate synthase component 2
VILLVDNYDSFTYNLRDYLLQLGKEVEVKRNDEPLNSFHANYEAVVLSPGSETPEKANNLLKIINIYQNHPVLGICLGHQAIATFFGSKIAKAKQAIHGKVREVQHQGDLLFKDVPEKFNVVRYHSLIVETCDYPLVVTSVSLENEVMSFRHQNKLIFGLQFHPESILTEYGLQVLKNWLAISKI